MCTLYDLYAVVHHQGVMGEGHYVTTVRKLPPASHSKNQTTEDLLNEEWICFNDGYTTTVKRDEIVACPSAYVLFYIRKDIQGKSVDVLFDRKITSDAESDSMNHDRKKTSSGGSGGQDAGGGGAAYRTPVKSSNRGGGHHQHSGGGQNGWRDRDNRDNDDSSTTDRSLDSESGCNIQ